MAMDKRRTWTTELPLSRQHHDHVMLADSHEPNVVCHTNHEVKWDGTQGVDWSHSHQEFDIQVGGTIGFEVYNARSGEFTRKGEGGYLNWAYNGNVVTNDQDGKHLVFAKLK